MTSISHGSIGHRCDVDCCGFEYEYRFAEYEYRKSQPRATLLVPYAVRKTQTARVSPPHPPTPSPPLEEKGSYVFMGGEVFFASLLLCVSQRSPRTASEGHATGLCYGVVVRGCVMGACYKSLVFASDVFDESPFSLFLSLKNYHVRCLHLDHFS